ncbi:MAG TPA: hypothetical protein VKN36_12810 [Eudoraea sp.]|nr:hypothetical protein [Eudoraea sp.]
MKISPLPFQPHPILSYLRVGKILYYSLTLFILESWVYWIFLERAWINQSSVWIVGIWGIYFLFSFVHIFLVIADGWSRYQNYKRAKDLFYDHGYRPRIARLYMSSKCQRNAALEAAKELGIMPEVQEYYKNNGVKWYHFLPYFMVQDPFFFIKSSFWNRTFLEKQYRPKYNYRKIQLELSI